MFGSILFFVFGLVFFFHAGFVPLWGSWPLSMLAGIACCRLGYCFLPAVRAQKWLDWQEELEAERRRREGGGR